MSFIKYVSPAEFEKLSDAPAKLIKVSSHGIKGSDLKELEKRASLFNYEKFVASLKPGEVPLHVIALGCDEVYGPNRNGDAFTKEACRKYHKTFIKYGHWFREHEHHDPKKSYGLVKDSAFNEKLGRIELLVVLNGTEEAAKRNRGLIADKELEFLESEKELPVSMACFADPTFPVLTPKGYVAISSLRTGDYVISGKGRPAKIREIINYNYDGRLYTIHLKNIHKPLLVTEFHPFVVLAKGATLEDTPKWTLSFRIKPGAHLGCLYNLNLPEEKIIYDPKEIIDALAFTLCDGFFDNPELISLLFSLVSNNKKGLINIFQNLFRKLNKFSFTFSDLNSAYNLFTLFCCLNLKPKLTQIENRPVVSILRRRVANLENLEQILNKEQLYFETTYPDIEVIKVEEKHVTDVPVWNLEVEEDHTYVSGGIISHNCKVAFDVCSGCGNRARSRKEYCTERTCKYGGLKQNIGRTFEDGHILRAFNPEPNFFDISFVHIPADRIAYTLGVIDLLNRTKNASYPFWLYKFPTKEEVIDQINVLGELAICERVLPNNIKLAGFYSNHPLLSKVFYDKISCLDIPEAVYVLSKNDIILPVEDFLIQFGGYSDLDAVRAGSAVRKILPDIFNILLRDEHILEKLENNVFYPRPPEEDADTKNIIFDKTFCVELCFDPKKKDREAFYSELDPRILELAKIYGLYQLASIMNSGESTKKAAIKSIIRINRL